MRYEIIIIPVVQNMCYFLGFKLLKENSAYKNNCLGVFTTIWPSKYGKIIKIRSYKASFIHGHGHPICLPIENYAIVLNS